ncbi:MAG: phage tail protein [Burkholderiaceae bacterium]|nr:phage tail protein [Burkholderiaceae bacterium]
MPNTSVPIQPIITLAGLAAAFNAQATGIAVQITHVGFGAGKYVPDSTLTALASEVKRVAVSGGSKTNDTQIQIYSEVKADAGSPFWCGEIGFYAGNVLFAVYSRLNPPILYISDEIATTAAYSLLLSALPKNSVNVSVDASISAANALIGAHEGRQNPHPQYAFLADLSFVAQNAVNKGGDTMTGMLKLAGNPTDPLHPVTKQLYDATLPTAVRAPVNTTPAAAAANFAIAGSLVATGYFSLYGIGQQSAQFQISTTLDFAAPVRDVTLGAVATWAITPSLSTNTIYYWRARYRDTENTWSPWSAPTQFTTGAVIVSAPTVTSPANNATGQNNQPTIASSAFATVGGADTHFSSRWQLSTDPTFATVLHDSGDSTTAKLNYSVPISLVYGTQYFVRVMHRGTTYGYSAWSPATSFTTALGGVLKPSITSPVSGANNINDAPTITASVFAYGGAADTHLSSDWQVWTGANGTGTKVFELLNSTVNKISVQVASGALAVNTQYFARTRQTGNAYAASAWSNDVSFTTVAQFLPTVIGQAFGGGYYMGRFTNAIGSTYALIVAPKALGENAGITISNGTDVVNGSNSYIDGKANTDALFATQAFPHPAAVWVKGLNIGGFTDWFIPARDQLEMLYRSAKPYNVGNQTGARNQYAGDGGNIGQNAYSQVNTSAYSTALPSQSVLPLFQVGGAEAFENYYYWSSTTLDYTRYIPDQTPIYSPVAHSVPHGTVGIRITYPCTDTNGGNATAANINVIQPNAQYPSGYTSWDCNYTTNEITGYEDTSYYQTFYSAWFQYFYTGNQIAGSRINSFRVRACRQILISA